MPPDCVLCAQPLVVSTSEHIFPEALGGRFQYNILCKPCNDALGARVDAPFVAQKMFQAARATYKIAGKTGGIPQPFSGPHAGLVDGMPVTFTLRSDFSARITPGPPRISITKDGEVQIQVSRDVEFASTLPKVVEVSLRRFFSTTEGKSLGWAEEDINGAIARAVRSAGEMAPVESRIAGDIRGRWEIDLRSVFVGLLKIAYEIACIETGYQYYRTSRGDQVRRFLFDQAYGAATSDFALAEVSKNLQMVLGVPDSVLAPISSLMAEAPASFHLAMVTASGLVVSCLGVPAVLQFEAPGSLDGDCRIYFDSVATKRRGVFMLSDLMHGGSMQG